MSYSKQAEAQRDEQPQDEAPPPAYDDAGDAALGESSASARAAATRHEASPVASGSQQQIADDKNSPSYTALASSSRAPTDTGSASIAPPHESITNPVSQHLPTVDSPFDFPSDVPLPPAYRVAAPSSIVPSRPIAVPQVSALPTSPFLPSYAPLLLHYGITSSSFLSFLSTISAFLTAKVSDRAISHAGDMAKSITDPHKASFKSVVSHAKAVGKDVGKNAKRGNVVGAALGVVGGTVTIPLFAVGGLIGTVASLPGTTIAAAVKKPKTPRQRAAAYIAVANEKWFAARGLYAVLLDSLELAEVLQVPVSALTEDASRKDASTEGQLRALEAHVERLEVEGEQKPSLELGRQTMWLVLSKAVVDEENGEVVGATS